MNIFCLNYILIYFQTKILAHRSSIEAKLLQHKSLTNICFFTDN
jgi:hypothetical protein